MATSLCPGQFFWACSFNDLLIQLVLIIIIMAVAVVFGIFLFLRGDWGGKFYHSDKSDIAITFEQEGSIAADHVESLGTMKMMKYGKRKGTLIIPRPNASFKTARSPNIRLVLGRGIGIATNPFLAPYIERMGGKWPEWSGQPPPAKPKDLRQFYMMYAKWKAEHEAKPDKQQYILKRMAQIEVPEVYNAQEREAWINEQKAEFGAEYDEGAWGPYTTIVKKLSIPSEQWGQEQYGAMETLNSAIQSEPTELWPTWIAGQMIDARELARWTEPVHASEMQSIINAVERALKADQRGELFKVMLVILIFFGIAVSFAIVYKVIGG